MTNSPKNLTDWIGRQTQMSEEITAWPLIAMAATIDRDDPDATTGSEVPPGWHWLYFLEVKRQSELGRDGHPAVGAFLPPLTLPRRMWAGGRIEFHAPLIVGDRARKVSTIKDIKVKDGRSGQLVFVTVRHELFNDAGLTIREEHDIVYREAAKPDAPAPRALPAPGTAIWSRTIIPDETMLFRYSALTFNGHRIHYDLDFCRDEEGYPGLVVHGPLTATLMMDLARRERPHQSLVGIDYRAISPVFGTDPYTVEGAPSDDGKTAHLWALNSNGGLAMEGTVTFG